MSSIATSQGEQSLDDVETVYNDAASILAVSELKILRLPFWSMLPKKNTSVATLALLFSLIAVPRAIAGSPLSVRTTITQPSTPSTLALVHSHQPKAKNLTLKQPFNPLSANISIASPEADLRNITRSQTSPNLPRKAESQFPIQFWGLLPILAILGLVWGWYRSGRSPAESGDKPDVSNPEARESKSTQVNTDSKLSDEMTSPQTVIPEKNTETSEALTKNVTATATPTHSESAVSSEQTEEAFSDTESLNSEEIPAETDETFSATEKMAEDLTVATPSAASAELSQTPAQSSSQTANTKPSEDVTAQNDNGSDSVATPAEEAISAVPEQQLNLKSDPNPSFNKAQFSDDRTPADIEAAKFNLGQTEAVEPQLASVDEGLAELPDGYGKTKIVLMPREPNSAYAYWDIPNEDKEKLRQQGGEQLALRFYDVTGIDMDQQKPHSVRQYDCDEITREWYIEVPISDRDYIVEIGYVTEEGRWLRLARSLHVRIPPVYPCEWYGDEFKTVNWDWDLPH